MADTVRPLSSGNQLAHHMLEVVYEAERGARRKQHVAQRVRYDAGCGI
jgi:hypothetical protein